MLVEDMIYADLFQKITIIWPFVIRIMTVQNNNFATNEIVPENSMLIVVEVKKFNPNKTWKKVQAKTQIKLKQQIQLLVKLKNTTLKYQ